MEELQSIPSRDDDRFLKSTESLRALRDQVGETIGDHRQRMVEIEDCLNQQLQRLTEELDRERLVDEQVRAASTAQSAELDQLRQTVTEKETKVKEKETEVEELLGQLAAQSLEFEKQIAERDDELGQILELHENESKQTETIRQQLSEARQALADVRDQQCTECTSLRDELTSATLQLSQLRDQVQTLQQQLETQQTELDEAQSATQLTQQKNEQAIEALDKAEQRIAELSTYEQNDEQLQQVRRKFELALADVHKLKRENTELHEELLSRPEASDQESPELVSLRSERDALAERVAELENSPAPTESADQQQEFEELQRRFELAVDDVRQLKQENAELEQRLTDNATTASTSVSNEAQDWQSQKARLLASLDAEDQNDLGTERREQLATIEGTISITDRVVAEKDALLAKQEKELKEFREQLDSGPTGRELEKLRHEIAAEILGDDEAIKNEREKLQQQQEILDAKLREAELEISVQRATLAREQSALEEKLAELSLTANEAGEATNDKPRRRWLSALGIKDDDDES